MFTKEEKELVFKYDHLPGDEVSEITGIPRSRVYRIRKIVREDKRKDFKLLNTFKYINKKGIALARVESDLEYILEYNFLPGHDLAYGTCLNVQEIKRILKDAETIGLLDKKNRNKSIINDASVTNLNRRIRNNMQNLKELEVFKNKLKLGDVCNVTYKSEGATYKRNFKVIYKDKIKFIGKLENGIRETFLFNDVMCKEIKVKLLEKEQDRIAG